MEPGTAYREASTGSDEGPSRAALVRGVVAALSLSVLAVATATVALVAPLRDTPTAPRDDSAVVPVAVTPITTVPTSETTGPRVDVADLEPSAPVVTTRDGQVIERLDVRTQVVVEHSDVVIRDVRIRFDGQEDGSYPIHVRPRCDTCAPPENVLIEYVEIVGEPGIALGPPAVFGAHGSWTLRYSEVHGMGSGPRLTNNTAVEYSYVHSIPDTDPDEHKSAVGLNGGTNNRVVGNRLECAVSGCSAALAMYGDFDQVDGVLVQGNLFNTLGSYCVYGGSVEGKPHPQARGVRILDNVFGREFQRECGIYGPVTGFDQQGEGNEWAGNVWADTGAPVVP